MISYTGYKPVSILCFDTWDLRLARNIRNKWSMNFVHSFFEKETEKLDPAVSKQMFLSNLYLGYVRKA